MKRYALVSIVLSFIFLVSFGLSFRTASALNCAPGDLFHSNTGKACSKPTLGCFSDNLFSSVTGERCSNPSASVTILSPNGGETFTAKVNDSITVRWRTQNVPASYVLDVIRLRNYNTGVEYPLAYFIVNDGSETVSIPQTIPADPYTLEIKSYLGNVLLMDQSDTYFKIANPNTECLPGHLFSATTGEPCGSSNLPAGCVSSFGFSRTTGKPCGGANIDHASANLSLENLKNISVGQPVNFNFIARDEKNNDLSWNINWGDGTTSSLNPGCPPLSDNLVSALHTWKITGNYKVSVLISDCHGGTALQILNVNVH